MVAPLRLAPLVAVAGRPRRAGADWTVRMFVVDQGCSRWLL